MPDGQPGLPPQGPPAASPPASAPPSPPPAYAFDLQGQPPDSTSVPGGLVRRANQARFPVLRGLAMFSLQLDPGAMRAPHLHTNASELDYVISGKARVGLVDASGTKLTYDLTAGMIAFFPQAWTHWMENVGDEPLLAIFADSNEQPITIEVAAIEAATAYLDRGPGIGRTT